ncbi:MAG: B12-binding domain-containing radical SAM protein, partial [Candidatus Methanodesulfokora sp.]
AMPLIPNLDEIPIPAYDLLPMHLYRFESLRFGTIITSRGCPFNCIFCSSSLQFGKRWRAHSKERVIEELRILHQDYGVREVEFLDDTFTLDRRRAREISREIVREGLDISWTASSRVNTFDLETGREMKRAGAHTIYFGIESGSQKILDLIGKGITVEQSISAVKSAKKAKLRALGSFIIGFPEETEDDIRRTIDFSKKVGVDLAQFTIATPYPGTKLWDIANKMNLLLTRDWRKYTTIDVVMKSFYLTERQIKKLLNWAYISFYLRPKMILIDLMRNKGFILRKAVPAALKFFLGGEGVKKLRKEISKL